MGSAQAWLPDESLVKELAGLLSDAVNPHDVERHRTATQLLLQSRSKPDISKYMAYLFSHGSSLTFLQMPPSQMTILRVSAAINLKNVIKSNFKNLDEATRSFIRSQIILCIADDDRQIRKITGTVISEIVQRGGATAWPDLFPQLLAVAANDTGKIPIDSQEGAMATLQILCEDRDEDSDLQASNLQSILFIIRRLLDITTSPYPQQRAAALACINHFIPRKSPALLSILDTTLERIFALATDTDPEVRRNICRSLVLIVDIRPDMILPHMGGLVEYLCTQQSNHEDPDSALEAAEFWLAVGENHEVFASLEPYLTRIVPVLLSSMVYDEDAIIRQSSELDDTGVEDEPSQIKPRGVSRKTARINSERCPPSGADLSDGEIEDDADTTENEESDDEEESDIEDQWTLRKCSAAALDVLAADFHQLVFDIVLGYLNQNLTHSEWPYREAAVLAIGAVAEGCLESVSPALPNVIPYLVTLLDDSEAAVRIITCWALGRYSSWAINLTNLEERTQYFDPILNGILARMRDRSKRVQTAAASAFATLGEKAGKLLIPHAERIIETFIICFSIYQDRNMCVLYDCVQTLANQIGSSLSEPKLIELLMPTLIRRWERVSDHSQELFPLNECLSYIASALEASFAPFAAPTFARAIYILHQNLEEGHRASRNDELEKPDKDFLVTSLDLLSAIIQALNSSEAASLVSNSQPRFFDLLIYCLQDDNRDVRQSAYALLGDCAVKIFDQLRPFVGALMPIMLQQLDVTYVQKPNNETAFSVINNACWSCGEIAIKIDNQISPYLEGLFARLKTIIDWPGLPVSVGENAIIAIGRLGFFYAQILAPHLGDFAEQFLKLIAPVDCTNEKAHAFLGLNRIIKINPYAMAPHLLLYMEASLEYGNVALLIDGEGETISQSFQQVLEGYKGLDCDYFLNLKRQLSQEQQETFKCLYKL